jgi:predicted nucleotidyltransferase
MQAVVKREEVERILGEHREELRAEGVRTLSPFGSTARDEADSGRER